MFTKLSQSISYDQLCTLTISIISFIKEAQTNTLQQSPIGYIVNSSSQSYQLNTELSPQCGGKCYNH